VTASVHVLSDDESIKAENHAEEEPVPSDRFPREARAAGLKWTPLNPRFSTQRSLVDANEGFTE
jgi:hypothetical protein